MSNQSTVTNVRSGEQRPVVESVVPKSFKWSTKPERSLLFNMIRLKPCGINKHLSVLLLREKMTEELKYHIPTKCIWKYLETKWDIQAADKIEGISFDVFKKDIFTLPEEYDQLISEESEKINKKNLEKKRTRDEINKRKGFVGAYKKRCKSNSMSSVDSKDGLNEISSSILSESTFVKTSEVGSEEPPARIRRSLRAYDKLEDKDLEDDSSHKKMFLRVNNKSDELNKSKDFKILNKKPSNQFKELEKNDKVSNVRGRKRKSRNVSESSFSSDNSKQPMSYKNNLTDLTVSDSSSRSVTPELLRGKTTNRSVTPESIYRKSNLRSSDRDQKSKLALEKACIKFDHRVDIIIPEIKIERLKSEKQLAALVESKSKNFVQNKNEASNKVKGKTRGRVTSDFLVVQQSPDARLGRRSCSNK